MKPERQKRERVRKLSYKEMQELNALPEEIEHLETEQQTLHQALSDPARYQDGTDISALKIQLEKIESQLETAYARWEALEEIHGGSQTDRA